MNFKWFTSPHVLKRKTAGGRVKGKGNKFTSRRSRRPGPFLSPERTASAWGEAAWAAGPRDVASAEPAGDSPPRGSRPARRPGRQPPSRLTVLRAPRTAPSAPGARGSSPPRSQTPRPSPPEPGLCRPRPVASVLCIFPPKAGFLFSPPRSLAARPLPCPTRLLPGTCSKGREAQKA